MIDGSLLREKVRQLMRAGQLPSERPDTLWGGPGGNTRCTVCGATITPQDIEMEIELVRADGCETRHCCTASC